MKRLFILFPLTLIFLAFSPKASQAATVFTPMSAAELQADFITAAGTAGDITIQLAAISYNTSDNGNATFIYSSTQDNSITVIGAGMGSTILDGGSAQQVLSLSNTSASAGKNITLKNLTIQHGEAADTGGLAIITKPADILVDSVAFSGNHSTGNNGVIHVDTVGGALTVTNCPFDTNSADGNHGVGNFNTDSGALSLVQNSFTNNFINATTGDQGVFTVNTDSGALLIQNNTFTNNRAGTDSGNEGVGDINSASGTLTLMGNTFTGNQSGTNTGDQGVFNVNTATSAILLQDNAFTNNQAGSTAGSGGVGTINTANGSITLFRNTFTGNSAGGNAGALDVTSDTGNITVDSNTFTKNTAKKLAGGIEIDTNSGNVIFTNNIFDTNTSVAGEGGGALIVAPATIDIINNTFFGNNGTDEGGGFAAELSDTSVLNLYNNISFGNIATTGNDIFVSNTAAATINLFNNDFDSSGFCLTTPVSCDPTILGGNQGANINQDPLFINAAAGNFNLGAGSPAIDTATALAPNFPTIDHDGNPRPFGPAPDMGALEAVPTLAVAPPTHDFGGIGVGANASVIITITNEGGVPADITGMTLSDDVNYNLDLNGGPNPCGSATLTLNGQQSCTVAVIFLPGSVGTFNATLNITSNDPQNPTLQVTLTGVGKLASLSGGGCSLGGAMPSSSYYLGLVLPLLLIGMRRWMRNS